MYTKFQVFRTCDSATVNFDDRSSKPKKLSYVAVEQKHSKYVTRDVDFETETLTQTTYLFLICIQECN